MVKVVSGALMGVAGLCLLFSLGALIDGANTFMDAKQLHTLAETEIQKMIVQLIKLNGKISTVGAALQWMMLAGILVCAAKLTEIAAYLKPKE